MESAARRLCAEDAFVLFLSISSRYETQSSLSKFEKTYVGIHTYKYVRRLILSVVSTNNVKIFKQLTR